MKYQKLLAIYAEILEEVKFHASFEVNICRREDAEEFLSFISSKNGTEMKAHRKEKARINYTSNRFNCGRRIRDERSEKNEKEEKKSGQGRLKGVERQVGKGTDCGALLSILEQGFRLTDMK